MEGRNKTHHSYCFSTVISRQHVFENCAMISFALLFCISQARKLLRELKYQKRCKEAVTTIAAFWHGTQVLSLIWKKLITKGNQLDKHIFFRLRSTKPHWLLPTHYTVGLESSGMAFPSWIYLSAAVVSVSLYPVSLTVLPVFFIPNICVLLPGLIA